jgi:hypothetical protein
LSGFATSWVKRAALPPPPFEGDDLVRPLCTVRMMVESAREFENCLRDQVIPALKGKSYYYVSSLLDTPVIVQIVRSSLTNGWALAGLYGKGNADVPENVKKVVKAWLQARGVETSRDNDRSWWALARLCEL